ncbi:hypothetical protein TNCV_2178881 [Trichonephila clavipes]|uniref:Uncharacterized protein n=1 Tax=Trichonephila clavipes TaxID=2585209 RepID=A0A8X6VUA5_TRICX|nr:hypothetical protein TNCV_2178881 [Trichonephila clavipes]
MIKVTNQKVVNPTLAAIQAEKRRDIESRRSRMTFNGKSGHNLCSKFTSILGWLCNCPPSTFEKYCICESSGDLVFKIMTRIRLAGQTVVLHGIPYILNGSSGKSFDRSRGIEGFVKTDPAGSHHLHSFPEVLELFKRRTGGHIDRE